MAGKVDDGDIVTVAPLGDHALERGEIVLCKVRGREFLHLVKAVDGDRYLIGTTEVAPTVGSADPRSTDVRLT